MPIPSYTYRPISPQPICIVCSEPKDSEVPHLACGHYICPDCYIDRKMRYQYSCPICAKPMKVRYH